MGNLPITVVTIARNEAKQIVECVRNTSGHAHRHIVIDMESEDGTADLARSAGADVFGVKKIPNFDAARIPGIEAATTDWILVLDADERISRDLWNRIAEAIQRGDSDLVLLPRANFALSGIALHESNWPEWQARLFRKSAIDPNGWTGNLHSELPFRPNIAKSRIPGIYPAQAMLHFTNLTVESFVGKINAYTSREAEERHCRAFSHPIAKIRWLSNPFRRFAHHYFARGGWKDGWRGFMLSGLFFTYEFLIMAKQWERHIHGERTPSLADARKRMLADLPRGVLDSSDRATRVEQTPEAQSDRG